MRRLILLPLAVAVALLMSCSAPTPTQPTTGTASAGDTGGLWTYVTGFGETVSLPSRPRVIVTDAYSAAALWEYGIRPAGVFGYGLEEGASPLALGKADRSTMTVVGTGADVNIEKLAALDPDVVIGFGNVNTKGAGWTWWDAAVTKKATAVAPFVGLRTVGQDVREVIEEYRRLAAALGGDTTSSTITQDRAAFQTASDTLRRTASRVSLDAIALSGDPSSVYVGGPGLAQLGLLNSLGAKTVGPASSPSPDGEDWAEVSWERIANYPADIVFAYTGSVKLFPQSPIYRTLPAVKAKQVATWDDKMPFTYSQYAAWLTQVNTTYSAAKKVA